MTGRTTARRLITAGFLRGPFVVLVWTPRGDARHIISMRHAYGRKEDIWVGCMGPISPDAPAKPKNPRSFSIFRTSRDADSLRRKQESRYQPTVADPAASKMGSKGLRPFAGGALMPAGAFTRLPWLTPQYPLQRGDLYRIEQNMNLTPAPHPICAPDFAQRLALILAPLAILVAARFRCLGPFTVPIWRHIARARARFAGLMALCAAGRLRQRVRDQKGRPGGPPPRHRLPSRHAWLLHALGFEAAIHAQQLQTLLDDPATQDLLAAAPAAARTLRPLCRLLGLPDPAPHAPTRPRDPAAPPNPRARATSRPRATNPPATNPPAAAPLRGGTWLHLPWSHVRGQPP